MDAASLSGALKNGVVLRTDNMVNVACDSSRGSLFHSACKSMIIAMNDALYRISFLYITKHILRF